MILVFEQDLLREQIVGLLQRHHWASHDLLLADESDTPARTDARQIYGNSSITRYLISRISDDRTSSDTKNRNDTVRRRILDAKPGNDLYLDAAVYKGAALSPFLIGIQHKIADRRNQNGNTMKILSNEERRARIEVMISGSEHLRDRGIATIDDFAGVSFRQMKKSLLHFRLGTLVPQQHLLDEAIE